jgi:para-aminobenzoate synthetase/4-amino-4-deoxychorismate lyase
LLAECPGADDVILFNDAGEVTESTRANIAIQRNGVFYTPPVSCGLLAGTLREALIQEGRFVERIISLDELVKSDAIYLVNSVRGMHPVMLSRYD